MSLNVKKFRQKVDDYFANVTKEQLHKDLVECGLELYNGPEYDFLDELETIRSDHEKTTR